MSCFEQYEHHGNKVWVREDLRGLHRDHCLCYSCAEFNPDDNKANCALANLLYVICCAHNTVTPVWECAAFKERKGG